MQGETREHIWRGSGRADGLGLIKFVKASEEEDLDDQVGTLSDCEGVACFEDESSAVFGNDPFNHGFGCDQDDE